MACDISSIDSWKQNIKEVGKKITELAEQIEVQTDGVYTKETAEADIISDLRTLRNGNEKISDILKNRANMNKLKSMIAERIKFHDQFSNEKVKRQLKPEESSMYRDLFGKANDFRRRLETKFLMHKKAKNKAKLESIEAIKKIIKDVTGQDMPIKEFIDNNTYDGWQQDYNVVTQELVLKGSISKETKELMKKKPLLKIMEHYIDKDKEHLQELFPESGKQAILDKMISKNLDHSKLYNMNEVGGKINNILFGNSRVILSNSEYEVAFKKFYENHKIELSSLKHSEKEMRKLFDILNNKTLAQAGTSNSDKILSANYASRDLIQNIEENFSIDSPGTLQNELRSLITKKFSKDPIELIDDGLESIEREKQLIKQFGKDPNELFKTLNDYIAKTHVEGAEKQKKLEHLKEARTFVQQVYQGKEQEIISDSTMINFANVFANKIAIPLALTGAALNHMFESVGYLTKNIAITGKVDPALLLKTFFGVFRDGSSLMVKIPLQTLHELPLGKTYKNTINHIAKTIDWSTLRKLSLDEHLELLSNIKLTTEEFAHNHTNGFDIGDDFAFGIPNSIAKISNVDLVDKFAIRRSKQGTDKIITRLMEHLLEGKKVNNAHKKILKETNTSKADFEMYRAHLEGDTEKMRELAHKEIIPEKITDLDEEQIIEFVNYKATREVNHIMGTLKEGNWEMDDLLESEIKQILNDKGFQAILDTPEGGSIMDSLDFYHSATEGKMKVKIKRGVKNEANSEKFIQQKEAVLENAIKGFKDRLTNKEMAKLKDQTTLDKSTLEYFKKFYNNNPDMYEQKLGQVINRRIEGVEGLKQHMIRYYNSARTDAGFKRALSGLDPKYHTMTDLLIKTKTLFTGVSVSAFEQGKMGAGYVNSNIRDEQGNVIGKEMAKHFASLAAVMGMVAIYTGVLYNLKNIALGKKANWSPVAATSYGMRDDIFVGASNTLINNYDSFASKLIYGTITQKGAPVLRAMKNNPLFYNYFLKEYVYGNKK